MSEIVFFDYVMEQCGVSFLFQTIKHELGYRTSGVGVGVCHDPSMTFSQGWTVDKSKKKLESLLDTDHKFKRTFLQVYNFFH